MSARNMIAFPAGGGGPPEAAVVVEICIASRSYRELSDELLCREFDITPGSLGRLIDALVYTGRLARVDGNRYRTTPFGRIAAWIENS